MNVKGQAAIVTGGASGLGGATASALAAAGAKVAIFDLQDELGEKKAKEIGGLYVKTNVSDAANTEASVKTVVEKLGAPRVVVNCAGIGRAARTISKSGPHDLGMFAQVIQVNLIGTFNVIRLASLGDEPGRADGRRRARRHHQHRLGGGVRRPDRPGGLLGLQGRRGRHDPADRARPVEPRHPRLHHRARPVPDADDDGPVGRGAEEPGRAGAVPAAAGRAQGIRPARHAASSRTTC